MTQGAVVIFGPDYLENSIELLKQMKGGLDGMAILSCERIDDLAVPEGPVLACSMIFFHRKPAHLTFGSWDTILLKNVDLTSEPPKGLGVPDKSPERPKVEMVPVGLDETQLIVTWVRPLEASHIVKAARALEHAYLENGGIYHPPGVFKRLKSLFS